eukprot:2779874-Alexandrium_andersonii.AAC.1
MPNLTDWSRRFELAAGRLEAAAVALVPVPEAGRSTDDFEFVEQIKEIEVMIDRFKDERVLEEKEEERGVAWCHRLAPFRRIEAAAHLHAPRC